MGASGILRVGIAFCSDLLECQILAAFLSKTFLGRPGVTGVSILGTDVGVSSHWPFKEQYVAQKHPRMQLQFQQMDLSTTPPPECALALGIHPEFNGNDVERWERILCNVIKSTRGLCVICTYFEQEAENAVATCRSLGVRHELHENPYWKSNQLGPTTLPCARFLVVIFGSVARAPSLAPQAM